MSDLTVHKSRRNLLIVDIGMDVSSMTITSEIRAKPDLSGSLIATWTVTNVTDGTDGLLQFEIDATASAQIQADFGYMDIKRLDGAQPYAVFERPVEVEFVGAVTA